jgi:hypothetical protein
MVFDSYRVKVFLLEQGGSRSPWRLIVAEGTIINSLNKEEILIKKN